MPRFLVEYRVTGTITHFVNAETQEEAEKKAYAYSGGDTDYSDAMCEIEEVTDLDYSVREMFRVRREEGGIAYTTYVRPTDTVLPEADVEVVP